MRCPHCNEEVPLPAALRTGRPDLRRRRKASGLTLREMGAMFDLSATYLSEVERGAKPCSERAEAAYGQLDGAA